MSSWLRTLLIGLPPGLIGDEVAVVPDVTAGGNIGVASICDTGVQLRTDDRAAGPIDADEVLVG